jgi:3'-5' exoribonuclease
LQYHTWEVLSLCSQQHKNFKNKNINLRILLLAALYHDYGKIWDYYDGELVWKKTEHCRKIHHISRSNVQWYLAVEKTGECRDIVDEVSHCILSHHLEREYGSPVFPKTREAWLLHICDQLSARMDDCDRLDLIRK